MKSLIAYKGKKAINLINSKDGTFLETIKETLQRYRPEIYMEVVEDCDLPVHKDLIEPGEKLEKMGTVVHPFMLSGMGQGQCRFCGQKREAEIHVWTSG